MTTPAPASRQSAAYPFSETAPAVDDAPNAQRGGTSAAATAWRWVSFVLGCVLLVLCAWALSTRLQQWSHDYGGILVFLVFFLIMSIAGRWFWAGIDAALGRVIRGSNR